MLNNLNKKIIKIVVSIFLLALISISCESKQDPTKQDHITFRPMDLVGTWYSTDGNAGSFTITYEGNMILNDGSQSKSIPITNWSYTMSNEVTSYELVSGTVRFYFKSSSECEVINSTPNGEVRGYFRKAV